MDKPQVASTNTQDVELASSRMRDIPRLLVLTYLKYVSKLTPMIKSNIGYVVVSIICSVLLPLPSGTMIRWVLFFCSLIDLLPAFQPIHNQSMIKKDPLLIPLGIWNRSWRFNLQDYARHCSQEHSSTTLNMSQTKCPKWFQIWSLQGALSIYCFICFYSL